MFLSIHRKMNPFLIVFFVAATSHSATVEVLCSVKKAGQVESFQGNANSVEFDSDRLIFYGPSHTILRQWENLTDDKVEIECTISPRESSEVLAYCTDQIKNRLERDWKFVEPKPLPAYNSEQFVGMTAVRTLVGMGRVWTQFKISLNAPSQDTPSKTSIALDFHKENKAFSNSPKFFSNYSGVNGLTELSPSQSCSIAPRGADTGVN